MFRYKIDHSEIRAAIKNFESVQEIDTKKEAVWFINQIYRDLSRKHGKRYSYVTPPGSERTNLRVRSRKLLQYLSDSRFVRTTRNSVTVGFDIPKGDPKGNYLGVHATDRGGSPFNLTAANAKYIYQTKTAGTRILIPLRAGMKSDGTPKPITGRSRDKIKAMPYGKLVGKSGVDWNGENTKKFHAKTVILYKINGRKIIPMYVIAKKARIPKRMFIGAAMDRNIDKFYNRLETQIEKALDRVSKKRNR